MKRSFSRAILHSKALSKEKEDLMLVFMLSNVKEIFKVIESFGLCEKVMMNFFA